MPSRQTVLVALVASAIAGADGSAAPPSKDQVAEWVRQLGADDFATRQAASKQLWKAGEAAEEALEGAAAGGDAEVARRARELLDRFRWGVYPDTPKHVVDLVARYRASERENADAVVQQLLAAGAPGVKALLKIAKSEPDAQARRRLLGRVAGEANRTVPLLLSENRLDTLESLLEVGFQDDVKVGAPHYAAFCVLSGNLGNRIARCRARAGKAGGDRRASELLAYLLRAKGDLTAAREAAQRAERADLVDALLFEAGDWKVLAARGADAEANHPVERLGYRAAYQRLAGDAKGFEKSVAELRKLAAGLKDDDGQAFFVAKALFLNDRPADALEVLGQGGQRAVAFEALCAQLRYREAFALVDTSRMSGGNDLATLELMQARVHYGLGEQDKAREVFARYGARIKPGEEAPWYEDLIDAEARVGLKADALRHAALVLSVSRDQGWPARLLPKLFPAKGETAEGLWGVLSRVDSGTDRGAVLESVAGFVEGKAKQDAVRQLVQRSSEVLAGTPIRGEEADRAAVAVAEVALASGQEASAREALAKANTPGALLRLGDLLAGKKDWAPAAERYRESWDRDQSRPLPLYLWGHALTQSGRLEEGRKAVEQSHWLPLGNESVRNDFARELSRRGFDADARRENDLLQRASEPGSYYSGEAQRRLAVEALGRKDYLAAADGHERAMLRCLRTYVRFVQPAAYLAVPAMIHRQRACGFLAAGKTDAARREAALVREALPGNADQALLLVGAFDRAGRKLDADALFTDTLAALEKVTSEYPRCGWAHNSAAWLSACCRRGLDAGLAHAEKAVVLAPDQSGYHDTLAEVRFQRGDRARAVAAEEKAAALNPQRAYYRKQLKRIRAGDPSAPRPDEDDGDDE